MKKGLKLGVLSLAALMTFGVTACNNDKEAEITEEQGKAWAEENGYIKYADTFTSGSLAADSKYSAIGYNASDLVTQMAKYHGTYLYVTTNPDGSTDVAWYPFSIKAGETENTYYISQKFKYNDDGTETQTSLNLQRNGEGMGYFVSHGMKEIVAESTTTYEEIAKDTPYASRKYYSYDESTDKYTRISGTQPADWGTGTYYQAVNSYTNARDVVFYNADGTTADVYGAKIYFEVEKVEEYTSTGSTSPSGKQFTLKVTKIESLVS